MLSVAGKKTVRKVVARDPKYKGPVKRPLASTVRKPVTDAADAVVVKNDNTASIAKSFVTVNPDKNELRKKLAKAIAEEKKTEIGEAGIWKVGEIFLQDISLVHHHIASYDHAIEHDIKNIILNPPPIEVFTPSGQLFSRVEFVNVIYHTPSYTDYKTDKIKKLFPKMCLDKDMSYLSNIYVELVITNSLNITSTPEKVLLGSIPAMEKSSLCNLRKIMHDEDEMIRRKEDIYNHGGTFIINGTRRKLTVQEGTESNTPFVYSKKGVFHAEIRSCIDTELHSTTTKIQFDRNGILTVFIPFIEISPIPLGIVFKALGITDEKQMLELITDTADDRDLINLITPSLEYTYEIKTVSQALHFIGASGKKFNGSNKGEAKGETDGDDEITEGIDDAESLRQALDLLNDHEKLRNGTKAEKETAASKIEVDKLKKEDMALFGVKSEQQYDQTVSYARFLLSTEFLPHLGYDKKGSINNILPNNPMFLKKAYFLAKAVKKLLLVKLGRINEDDRDHYSNKECSHAGSLLVKQFSTAMRKVRTDIETNISLSMRKSKSVNRLSLINSKTITTSMCSAISNNSWSIKKNNTKGISQTFDNFNYIAGLADSRKCVTPINSNSGKIDKPRKLHGSHWSIFDPDETPEGKSAGLIKMFGLTCTITTGSDPKEAISIIKTLGIHPINTFENIREARQKGMAKISVNSDPIGFTDKPDIIVNTLKKMKRKGNLDFETSICYHRATNHILVSTKKGRLIHPMLVVENGKILLKEEDLQKMERGEWNMECSNWVGLLIHGFVEYVDSREVEYTKIVGSPDELKALPLSKRLQVTHCEFHASLAGGIGTSVIQYRNHNQAPRNCYQASMGKQAIGIPFANYMYNQKGKFRMLEYPQKRLVSTRAAKIIGFDNLPSWQNAIVAIMPYEGLNCEDSLVMKKEAVERGLGTTIDFIPFETKVNPKKCEAIEIPLEHECNKYKYGMNISKLQSNGVIAKGTKVFNGDVLIGKTVIINPDNTVHSKNKNNISVVYEHTIPGVVHSVEIGTDGKDRYAQYVKVIVCQYRIPEAGDKFAQMNGQKGTVGLLVPAVDLPTTEDGITPDFIINPLAFPSRMTLGMPIEMLDSKKLCSTNAANSLHIKRAFDPSNPEHMKQDDTSESFIYQRYGPNKDNRDATPFQRRPDDYDIEKYGDDNYVVNLIGDELAAMGLNRHGDCAMIDGKTGRYINCEIFMGPCSYQRLKHLVQDKIHSRPRGRRNIMTRQPVEGRQAGGGLRIGTMEVAALLAHGAINAVKDRMMDQSDAHVMWFCKRCGFAIDVVTKGDPKKNIPDQGECRLCGYNKISKVALPYAQKLSMQEFAGMNVIFRVMTSPFGTPQVIPVDRNSGNDIKMKIKEAEPAVIEKSCNASQKKGKKKTDPSVFLDDQDIGKELKITLYVTRDSPLWPGDDDIPKKPVSRFMKSRTRV